MHEMPLLELPDTVVLPGMTVTLHISRKNHVQLVKRTLEMERQRFVISWDGAAGSLADSPTLPRHGTGMALVDVAAEPDGIWHVTAHGRERYLNRISRTEEIPEATGEDSTLKFVHDEPAPIRRDSPGIELVEAWDALEEFRRYARNHFREVQAAEIEEHVPDDPFYLASFIGANLALEADQTQEVLDAGSLSARLRLLARMARKLSGPDALRNPRSAGPPPA